MTPEEIVHAMYANDAFSQWLEIKILKVQKGYCSLGMTVRKEMTNGFGVAHGGIAFSMADSALAFASNSHGLHSVSIETSISHTRPIKAGDQLQAEARELNLSQSLAVYEVTLTNQDRKTVALFKGTVFRLNKKWELSNDVTENES